MISEIKIKNFKSIQDLTLKLGRVTVLIGENGSGKSNILEAIAFAGRAAVDKLDNEFLYHRGIRVTEDAWMVSAFPTTEIAKKRDGRMEFSITSGDSDSVINYFVSATRREDNSFFKWKVDLPQIGNAEAVVNALLNDESKKSFRLKFKELTERIESNLKINKNFNAVQNRNQIEQDLAALFAAMPYLQGLNKQADLAFKSGFSEFLIFAPENSVLRLPPPEGTIQPLGSKGEGLFRLLQSFTDEKFKDRMIELQSRLHLFGWFDKFLPPDDSAINQARLQIHDRWLAPDNAVFDQRSANEGFLFVLFYFTLLMSWRTPVFFAIDNIDTALNPKLCSTLMEQVVELAKQYGKQVICTTHNPAILDGLNLKDEEQRLYTVSRDSEGHTKLRRVTAPEPQPGEAPVRLSEAFQRGLIGGLPDNF